MRYLIVCVAIALSSLSALAQVTLPAETFPYDETKPAAGLWYGNLLADGQSLYGVVQIDAEDGWSVQGTIPVILALGAKATDVSIDGRTVKFSVGGQAGVIAFTGEVSEDGQRISGSITSPGAQPPAQGTFELGRTMPVMQLPAPRAYTGSLVVPGAKLDMTMAMAETPGGNWVAHLDIPMQMTRGLVLTEVKRDGSKVSAVMPGPAPAVLTFDLSEDENTLTGTLAQAGMTINLELTLDEGYMGPTVRRPQHPKPPYPYRTEDHLIPHVRGHALAGTLTLPNVEKFGPGPYPTAVLVSGSGPQDRDETIFDHKPFLVIADHLTRNGIAVFRYDDRGVGESTGDPSLATSEDFAGDTVTVVRYLMEQPSIDGRRVGVIGHSEGGMIAPMVWGVVPDVAYLVLMAGPGVPGHELLLVQGEKVRRASGVDEEGIRRGRAQQEAIFKIMLEDQSKEQMAAALRPIMAEALQAEAGLQGDVLAQAVTTQTEQLLSPWMLYFVRYDPAPVLASVHCPVLAINGTLDLQVWHEQNLDAIERIRTEYKRPTTTKRYEKLNHLFQPAKTGAIEEYAVVETTVDQQVLGDLTAWILETVKNVRER